MGMTATAAPRTVTVEARIWNIANYGQGSVAKLYLGSGRGRYSGMRQFRTRIPLSDSDQATWFQVTLEDDVIVGVSVI